MPELPEVETVVRTLEKQIQGRTITKVKVRYDKIITGDPRAFERKLKGETFRQFERRGKYLIFRMDHVTLVSHLRMEGKYYIQSPEDPLTRHMHVIFSLDNGKELRYNDTRKFGRMELLPLDYDFDHFKDLGPEPFDDKFNADYIHVYRKGKKTPLKSLLLDQSFTAGIGNIYADEILAACNLRPGRSCARITRKDEGNIALNTKKILKAAIKAGGTTIRTYTSSLGVTGRFQTSCSVHMQKICGRCGGKIEVKYIGGRSSYYCPHCQH
jgi:formamidopyrimidine-DNA glycosylase